jgi:hypothetical protein
MAFFPEKVIRGEHPRIEHVLYLFFREGAEFLPLATDVDWCVHIFVLTIKLTDRRPDDDVMRLSSVEQTVAQAEAGQRQLSFPGSDN